jgi:glycosyltransferase involved in cell wall biosynthesis
MRKIKYIAFYASSTDREDRQSALSASNKIDYICKALNKNNYKVEIISPSWTKGSKGFYKGGNKKIDDNIDLRTFRTFGSKNRVQRMFKYIYSLIQLFFYLLINTHKNEPVIVYHSVLLSIPIRLAKFFKKFKLILEIEEIYQDFQTFSKNMKKNEYKLFAAADKFIFPTELLNEKVNKKGKPYSIIYGTYQVERDRKSSFTDDKVHVVYAGTFDPRKGGTAAISAATYLTRNYHVHLIGFGDEEQIRNIKELISESSKISECTISYDGLLKGEEYIRFLQSCHIGLCPQMLDATFNNTSFPSKILSYMANGLRVVSVRIKAIEMSAIGDAISYYDGQDPKAIAKTIMSIEKNNLNESKKLIKNLDKKFIYSIKELLEN